MRCTSLLATEALRRGVAGAAGAHACRAGYRIPCAASTRLRSRAASSGAAVAGRARRPQSATGHAPPQSERQREAQRRVDRFKRTLREPHDIWVRGSEVRKQFALSRDDLAKLGDHYITKESPYESKEPPFKQYSLKEVVEMAKRKHGEERLIDHYRQRYLPRFMDSEDKKIYGIYDEEDTNLDAGACRKRRAIAKQYWYNAPSTKTMEGRQSVLQGLKTNSGICMAKGAVWFATGSHAMFADWMHSIADVANYTYRLLELNRSGRSRDFSHPYGYAPLRYITADRSFVFLGFVGGICPVLLGVGELLGAVGGHIPVGDHLAAPAAVFVVSGILEGMAMRTAYREIESLAGKEELGDGEGPSQAHGFRRVVTYLKEGRDVMSTATFAEASSGVLGAGIGLLGLSASWCFQSGMPDVAASVLMGSLVCGLSSFLMRKSGNALLGQTLPRWRVKEIIHRLEEKPVVVNIYDVKTEMVGTDTVRFKAEVQFNPQAITQRILRHNPGETMAAHGEAAPMAPTNPLLAYATLEERFREILPSLRSGVSSDSESAAWLYRNNGLFYEALAWELKDVEKVIRNELRDFRNVHIDLEPW